ncbi:MAG: glutamyl-tRNA reductase [Fibrobacter sp.]|nr:glutamyl-tRNA reductase [Fibrobacter sp.]
MKNKENTHCVVLGASHKTCPVALRDRLGFSGNLLDKGLSSLGKLPGLSEVVILSTCNRTEIYAATLYPDALRDTLINWWAEFAHMDAAELVPHCFYLTHTEAISHLYTVVSSLDSLVLGETQIMGQVKEAFQLSQKAGNVGFFLSHLFQSALTLGKKVREDTAIGEGTVSIPFAAVQLALREFDDLSPLCVGILGLGDMGNIASVELSAERVTKFRFFNRTLAKAQNFAARFGGEAYDLYEMPEKLKDVDLLIAAASSPEYLVTEEMVKKANRTGKTVYIDIGAPRNIDPAVANLPNVSLFSIDDLSRVVEDNRNKRRHSAERAREIISDAVDEFAEWYATLGVIPLMLSLRKHHETIGQELLQKWEHRVSPEEMEHLRRYNDELIAKLLHRPSSELKRLGAAGMGLESQLILEKLFDLKSED